ncbi:hypothetical protein GCM10010106_30690 [Thermopolyspora flexuosa]|nr:hypothetical protein GCM10010106_30690 [Thermopolyspora flexuosa]
MGVPGSWALAGWTPVIASATASNAVATGLKVMDVSPSPRPVTQASRVRPCRTGAVPGRTGYGRPDGAWITADVSGQQDSGMPSCLGSGAASAASKPTGLSLRMRADTPSVR